MGKMLRVKKGGNSYSPTNGAMSHDIEYQIETGSGKIRQKFYFIHGKLSMAVKSQRGAIK